MNRLLFFFFCLIFFVAAKGQRNYQQAIDSGYHYYKKGDYKTAINKYFAAEAFDPTKKNVVKDSVNKAFDAIAALKNEALKNLNAAKIAETKATEETKKAHGNYLISEAKSAVSTDPTLALRLAEQAMRYYDSKLIRQAASNIYMDKSNIFYKIISKIPAPLSRVSNWAYMVASNKRYLFRDNTGVHVIDLATKNEKLIRINDSAEVFFSNDGNFLLKAKVQNDYNYSIFDSENQKLGEFVTDTNYAIQFSLKNGSLVAYNRHKKIEFLDFNGTIKNITNIENIKDMEDCDIAVSESEFYIFTYKYSASSVTPGKVDRHYNVKLWNNRGEMISDLSGKIASPFNKAIFLSERIILLKNYDNTVTLMNAQSGEKIGQLLGHSAEIISISISNDKKKVFTYSLDSTIREWEIRDHVMNAGGLGWIDIPEVKFANEGKYYYTKLGSDTAFYKYPGFGSNGPDNNIDNDSKEPADIVNNEIMKLVPPLSGLDYNEPPGFIKSDLKRINAYCYLQDKKSVLVGINNEPIRKLDTNGKLLQEYEILWDEDDAMDAISISADKKVFITGNRSGFATVWRSDGVKLYTVKCHSYDCDVIISPDSKFFITMGDKQAKLWDLRTGLHLYTYEGIYHPDMAWYAPNGEYVLVKLNEGGVMLSIPMSLTEFLKSDKIEPLSAEQKKQYDIK